MNRNLKKYVALLTSLILALYLVQSLYAQPSHSQEGIHIRTDRDLYIVGEDINFKLFTLDGSSQRPVHYSDIVYLELLDRQHSPLIRKIFKINRGESSGKLVLPSEMSSDHYMLRAYTSWMKNAGPDQYACLLITVVNPFEKIRPEMILTEGIRESDTPAGSDPQTNSKRGRDLSIKVTPGDNAYNTRQKVLLDIETTNRDGIPVEANLMASLAREGLINIENQWFPADANPKQRSAGPIFPPEWGGHMVSGHISERPGGKPKTGDTLLLSIVGKSAVFDYAISDSNGNFRFLVQDVEGLHEIVIQHVDPAKINYQIRLDDPFSDEFADIRLPDFYMDTNSLSQINQAIINAQIKTLYGEQITPANGDEIPLSFYGKPEIRVMLGDYLRLPEMYEVFFELIPSAQMRGRGRQKTIRVRDQTSGMLFDSQPLLLVDGVVTRDASHISGLDAREVERIDLVNRDYYFGLLHFQGLLNVVTTDGTCPLELPEQVFRQSYEFTTPAEANNFPAYEDENQIQSTWPDFRNTLYWDPGIRTDKNGRARIEFYTGDDVADYILMLDGFTMDGQSVSYSSILKVRNK